jgi:hypothetical protein
VCEIDVATLSPFLYREVSNVDVHLAVTEANVFSRFRCSVLSSADPAKGKSSSEVDTERICRNHEAVGSQQEHFLGYLAATLKTA